MTAAPPAARAAGRIAADRAAAALRHPVTVWIAFVAAHVWLGMLGLYAPGMPLGDVTIVYRFWVEHGVTTGEWVGIDTVWVYPILALVPMLAAFVLGPELYASSWLTLVTVGDAAAFAVLLGVGGARRVLRAAWWWIAFLVALGPVALGRIDAIAVAAALAGLVVLAHAPRLAGVLLAVAAWTKVWPAALVGAVVVAVRTRGAVVVGAAATSAAVLVAAIALGGAGAVFSFLGQQAGRGLQIEAVMATPWMWDAALGGPSRIYYDTGILTYQLRGDGVVDAAAVATPLLAVAVAVLLGVAVLAMRRGADTAAVLPPLALAITVALIAFNKVGSPQFATWLAVPIVYGLVVAARGGASFRVPAVLGLVIAALTQLLYPYLYGALLGLDLALLVVLTVRNVLYLALFAWAVWALADAVLARNGARAHARARAVPDAGRSIP